ncbi:enolase-phosphatase E1-like [Chaetodon trifascialis]|uniref:enolase-phosphatase E1-like n=1 Tax=Chaetodon trifascialis TaxID=109706 RepID=UPI0039921F02
MSHNYPYRRPSPDSDLRPDPGSYSSSDRQHASSDHNFYRLPQESFSSYPSSSFNPSSSSSSSSTRGAQWSQDGALSILSSCGLEPSDLALLAEMPEDVLTVESLPHVLQQIKGKRGTVKPFPPSAPSPSSSSSSSSYPHSSARPLAVGPSTGAWDHPHSQLLQYPLDHVTQSPLPSGLNRWGNPRTSSSVTVDPPPPPSSSSSSYMVDFHHRPGPSEYSKTTRNTSPVSSQDFHHRPGPPEYSRTNTDPSPVSSYQHRSGPSEYGKPGRNACPVSSQDQASLRLAGGDKRTRPSHFSQLGPADYRLAPPLAENHPKTRGGCRETEPSSSKSSSQPTTSLPSRQEALDFHGTCPPAFPYSCCLCNITVMSEKVWIKHINGANHADGQLSLLQRFPNWDCRMETVTRADNQSEKWKMEEDPGRQLQPANQESMSQPTVKAQKKTLQKGKVVCVKFPAQSVDEAYLRKLTEPFGKIVKIVMFPSLAFVELGSVDQAKDLVKFHTNYPPTVNGEQMEFSISKTFSFLQSSRVVSFTPAPTGENGKSDLISIVKRFGLPLYTLFLPSMAFVEMKNAPDAQKMVDFYSSSTLRINEDVIRVSFSGEYKSLMRVPSAKRYEEEPTERTRSSSREKEDKTTGSTRRRSSKGREEGREKSSRERKTRTRSKSREKSTQEKRTRTRSKSREKSREKSSREKRSRSSDKFGKDKRTRSRSKSREKSSRDKRSRSRDEFGRDRRTRSRSKSREKSTRKEGSWSKSRSRGKLAVPEKTESTDTKSRTDPDPAPVRDSEAEAEAAESEEEAEMSAEDSDIEGMEVIGEDGENLENEDMEALDDTDVEEEQEEEGKMEEAAERTDSSERGEEEETKDGEADDREQQQEKEEPDFPVDLENCITLDELEEDQSDDQGEEVQAEQESLSMRVVYFKNLPLRSYPEAEFVNLVRDFGTAVRFYHKPPSCGFIEMSSSSEALRAVKELTSKFVTFYGSKLVVQISNRYRRLHNGWPVPLDEPSDEEKRTEHGSQRSSSRRSERQNRIRKSEGRKESSRETPEKESTSEKTPEEKSMNKKVPEEESTSKKVPEGESSKKVPEEESTNKKVPEEESTSKNVPEEESTSQNVPEEESTSKNVPEEESTSKKVPEEQSTSKNVPEEQSTSKNVPEEESTSKKVPEEESTSKKAPEEESTSKKVPEEESTSKKVPEEESTSEPKKVLEEESTSEKTSEKKSVTEKEESTFKIAQESLSKKAPENESVSKMANKKSPEKVSVDKNASENTSRTTPENEVANEKTPDESYDTSETACRTESALNKSEVDSAEKDSAAKKTEKVTLPEMHQEQKTLKRKATHDNDSVPEKKKNESKSDKTKRRLEADKALEEEKFEVHEKEGSEEETFGPGLKDSENVDPSGSPGDLPKTQTEQAQDSQVQEEQQSGSAGGAAELQKPTKPVGAEFVRPVVGYFCHLCQLIYADEDEAKVQHCSSLTHYRKYQEKRGKDPWAT